jgi:hypothetical protein
LGQLDRVLAPGTLPADFSEGMGVFTFEHEAGPLQSPIWKASTQTQRVLDGRKNGRDGEI